MKKPFDNDYPLTQGFGLNPADYAKFGLKGHNGLDYGLPSHTEVKAPHHGKIIEAASDPPGYGNYLKIENDIEGSVLAHLLSFVVGVGDEVSEGQTIAYSDNTGNSTGPHLHWGYYRFPRDRNNGYNGFIDQSSLIAPNPVPNPQPDPCIQTDQTKINLGILWGIMEVQAIRSKLTDQQNAINSFHPTTLASYSSNELISELFRRITGR